jgi:hypothetical protein
LPQAPRDYRVANNLPEGQLVVSEKSANKKSANTGKHRSNPAATANADADSAAPATSAATTTNATNDLQAQQDTLTALMALQEQVEAGIDSVELGQLLKGAQAKFELVGKARSDTLLNRDLKDALDAYQLVLDALKRRAQSADAARLRYDKIIDNALEIAERALTAATQRLTKLTKLQPSSKAAPK